MEVKLYISDPKINLQSLSSNIIKSHVSIINSSSIIDADYLDLEFEMVTLEATNSTGDYGSRYMSLKDISPPPGLNMKERWREVQLKDPLIQQAAWAWAYLPLTNTEHQRSSFILKLRDGFVGCFKNVVLVITAKLLPDHKYETDVDQEPSKNFVDCQY